MDTEEGSTSQVRRTSRARKINPKFFGDDAEYGSYKMLVDRITASKFTGINKDNENLNSDASTVDTHNLKSTDTCATSNQLVSTTCNTSGSINIALKTVSVKIPKKSKSSILASGNFKIESGKVAPPSVIVHCRSSTESEISEDSAESESNKRKSSSQEGSALKKAKVSCSEDENAKTLNASNETSHSSNIKVPPFVNCSQLFRRSYVPLPIVSSLDRNQPKIVVTSEPKLNLPGKKLKIVSLKPITTIKKDISLDAISKSNSENVGNKLMLGEGGPVELKIVKKQIYPVSGSSLPPIILTENKNEQSRLLTTKVEKMIEPSSPAKLFSSDGEDDIPLKKFVTQNVIKRKKKSTQKDNGQKDELKGKIKNKKMTKSNSNNVNDQDDLPLKAFIKKSKAISKGLSSKVKNAASKKKAMESAGQITVENMSQISEPPSKKKNIDSDSLQKAKVPFRLKINKLKSGANMKSQKTKPLVLKKKKMSSVNNIGKTEKVKNGFGVDERKYKKFKKAKAKQFLSNTSSSDIVKKKENKGLHKLRFKFPKKLSKVTSTDSPLSNETTNIVISVSGIEGDYACVAIDKDHISVPCDDDYDDEIKTDTLKSKTKLKGNIASSKKYIFDSGLVLEEDVSNAPGISQTSESKGELVSEVEPSSTGASIPSVEKNSVKKQDISKKETSAKKELSTAKKESLSPRVSASSKKELSAPKKDSWSPNVSASAKKEINNKKFSKKKMLIANEESSFVKSEPGFPKSGEFSHMNSSQKKESILDPDITDTDVKYTSSEVEFCDNKSAANKVDSLCDTLKLSDEKFEVLTTENKPLSGEVNTVNTKAKSVGKECVKHTNKTKISLKEKSSSDKVESDAKVLDLNVEEVKSTIHEVEETTVDAKPDCNIGKHASIEMKIELDKTKGTNCKDNKKHLVTKSDEIQNQIIKNEINNPIKTEINFFNENTENLAENKLNFQIKGLKLYKDAKTAKSSGKETVEKENRESTHKLDVKRDKEKDKKKEEKVIDLKSEYRKKFDPPDFQKHKNQKSDNKKEKYIFHQSPNDSKSEERHIKKEKFDSKEYVNKIHKDKSKEKCEKSHKDLHTLKKVEKPNQSFGKVEKDLTIPKQNKDANKLADKKEVVVDKECSVKDVPTSVIKPKKRENFEEALLNIPLPKLSKSKNKDDKVKKTPSKDKKYDSKEIHLLKHKDSESSKCSIKSDRQVVKSELSSREVKSDEKGYRREERKHSIGNSDKSERKRYHCDSKDSINMLEISRDDDKSKRDERERSRHSHKKHKREYSDSHRSHLVSSERKKHRTDEKYNKKHKDIVTKADSKDIIIKKIVDGNECNLNIKAEKSDSVDNSTEKNKDELLISNLPGLMHAKIEPEAEVIIDEEYLTKEKGLVKEEIMDVKSCILDEITPSNVSVTCLKKEPFSSELKKEELLLMSDENTQKENISGKVSSCVNKNESNEINISENVTETSVSEIQVRNSEIAIDVTESDIGILDELRNLKRTFEKPQVDKTTVTSANNVSSLESEVNLMVTENSGSNVKLESSLYLQDICKQIDGKCTNILPTEKFKSTVPPSKSVVKLGAFDTVSLDDSYMMKCSDEVHSKSENDEQKINQSQESVNFENSKQMDTKSNESDNIIEEKENFVKELNNLKNNVVTDVYFAEDRCDYSSFKNNENSPHYSSIPISSIPLPNENIKEHASESIEFESSLQEKQLCSSQETPMSISEPHEGLISKVSTTRENFSSDGDTPLASDLSDDEFLSSHIKSTVSPQVQKELTPEEMEEMERKNKEIVQERMKSFELLTENLYLSEKVKNKRSKEVRRMVCDCTLTKEEISNDEMGCGDDCLNRLLMIECGTRCPLKDLCMNKKFQQKDYSKVEVFNAAEKGCGVRSCEDINPGTFIMEYIGEVFDTREFKRRRKEYAKNGSPHFYFMALRPDRLIDATRKGGISRFINHSCSPNAETQKWTVNGDIRIGFFATKFIPANEEITFDYRLERYGREPQKCFCGTPECRGWLGEPPDKKTKEEKEEDRRRELKDKLKRESKRFLFEDMDLEDEIEKLTVRGLRNRQDTLDLSRLMVRSEDSASRLTLLKILESGEEASKRLFLDYHGLKLLWSWMVDISSSHKCIPLKLEILKTLESLPITNKTQVSDSRVICIVERWSKLDSKSDTKEVQSEVANKKLSDGSDSDTETADTKEPSPVETPSPPDDSSQDSNEVADVSTVLNKIIGECEESSTIDAEGESKYSEAEVGELAKKLLSVWSELKEAFKIPKKKRIEMMKEHEKEVDDEYAKYLDKKRESTGNRTHSYYDSWRYTSIDRDKQKDYRDRFDRDRRRDRRWSKWRDSFDEEDKALSKEERREKFAKQVAKEEEEARQRKLQEEMWNLHLERCNLLGHDPYYTPIFDPSGQYYWDPDAGNWCAYVGPSGNLPVPASYGMSGSEVGVENICPNIPSQKLFGSGLFYPLPHTPVLEGEKQLFVSTGEDQSSNTLDLASIPLPGEAPLSKSPKETSVVSIPLPGEENVESLNGVETPPMAPPGPVTIKLPSKWKIARDIDRRIYFYHTKTRHTQWELPTEDLHEKLLSCYGLTSDSESDLESDSDSSSSSDSEDFSSDEDDNDEDEPELDPVKKIENELNEKMIRRPKGKKVRSEKLVQERVISPILFEDREAARRERKEAKERARVEVRKERYGLLKKNTSGDNTIAVLNIGSSKADSDDKDIKLSLSEENITSPNDNDEDDHLEEQLMKFSRKQKSESKSHFKAKSKERAATALADTSDLARKIKDNFRSRMATYIVSVLNPYRKADCKEGRITSNEDFKYLARKLTHFVMVKELKQLPSIDGLECSDSVKHKTKEFVRKYMSKYGDTFKRDPNDTKEY